MLAYVFWHTPGPGAGGPAYEDALLGFHDVLGDDPPEGFVRSAALRVAGASWLPGGSGYEDWYLVEGFGDLGRLNEAAVAGRRRGPHDDVALRSAYGAGGVYALWAGTPEPPSGPTTWCAKQVGVSYEDLRSSLSGTTWLRQLVLGPAPELCLRGGAQVPPGTSVAATTTAEVLWPRPATPNGP